MAKRRRPGSARDFPRTARVNELLREIIGDELERLGDARLEWVSVTAVEVNPELTSAKVYYSSLGGAEADPEVLGALAEHRRGLQAAIGRQARLRRTPELHFAPDPGVREGLRVEELLAELHHDDVHPDDVHHDDVHHDEPSGAAAEATAGEDAEEEVDDGAPPGPAH